jgi:hypothetical protein
MSCTYVNVSLFHIYGPENDPIEKDETCFNLPSYIVLFTVTLLLYAHRFAWIPHQGINWGI